MTFLCQNHLFQLFLILGFVESSDIFIFDETSESSDSPVLPVINCKLFLTWEFERRV